MDGAIKNNIPEAAKKAAEEVIKSNNGLSEDDKKFIINATKTQEKTIVDYDGIVSKVSAGFEERMKKASADTLGEIAKIKGQAEATKMELHSQIATMKSELLAELAKRGLPVSSGTFMDDLKKGFFTIAGIRIYIVQIILSSALQKSSVLHFNESADTKDQTWMEFFYSTNGSRTLYVPGKPIKLKATETLDIYLDDIISIQNYDASGVPISGELVRTYDNVDTTMADLTPVTAPGKLKISTSAKKTKGLKATVTIEGLAALTGFCVIERRVAWSVHTSVSIKSLMFKLGSLALAGVSSPLALTTSLIGEDVWDRLMGDVPTGSMTTPK